MHFLYYSWVSLYYFSYLLALSTILSTKKFQFQLNKLFPNRLLINRRQQLSREINAHTDKKNSLLRYDAMYTTQHYNSLTLLYLNSQLISKFQTNSIFTFFFKKKTLIDKHNYLPLKKTAIHKHKKTKFNS